MIKAAELKYIRIANNDLFEDQIHYYWSKKKKIYRFCYFVRKKYPTWKLLIRNNITKIYLFDKKQWYPAKKKIIKNKVLESLQSDVILQIKQKHLSVIGR